MPRGHVLPDGTAVAALRGEAGLTQEELAERSGYGLRTISKVESGRRTTAPTLSAVAVVLAEVLRRPIELVDLLRPLPPALPTARTADEHLIVAENVKLLELSARPSGRGGGPRPASLAVLTDTFRVRHLPETLTEINFYYAMCGTSAMGGSLSHPLDAEWLPTHDEAPPQASAQHGNCHVLRVNMTGASGDAPPLVQNRVEYIDGFAPQQQNWFRTYITYPTDCLTVLVRFPKDQPYRTLRGLCRQGGTGPLVPTAEKPLSIVAGRMAYWRIVAPQAGETYHLGWI